MIAILKEKTGWGVAQLRHISPGIAEHYGIDVSPTSEDWIVHRQKGQGRDVGGRLYSCAFGSHSKLTNPIIHDTLHLCSRWEGLNGFSGDRPQPISAESMIAFAKGPAYQCESELAQSVKELLSLLTAPLGSSNIPIVQYLASIQAALPTVPSSRIAEQPTASESTGTDNPRIQHLATSDIPPATSATGITEPTESS